MEAVVSYFGEDYDLVGIDKGEKMELDEVENGTTVHINNIDSDSFSFVGGEGTASFSDITVYYVGTPNTCEHSFTGEYLNNGDTHLRKCAYCDAYGAESDAIAIEEKAEEAIEAKVEEIVPKDVGALKAAVPNGNVARIGSTEYATVTTAVEMAAANATIVMIADSKEDITIPKGKTVTLDLNGKTLTGTGAGSVILVYGGLTLTDGTGVVRDFQPAMRISDGAVGLYDLVENVMLVNANKTGAFTAGPDCPSLPKNGFLISIH